MKVGIDLGTTYSLIARLGPDGTPILLPDHVQHEVFHTPSVVCLVNGSAFVGRLAEAMVEEDPEIKALRFFKRNLGEPDPIYYDVSGAPWHAEAVAALVLKKLRFDAESCSSTTLDSAAITVPAHFNDVQRKAVLAAAALADIDVLGLVEEPVAAAMHYGVTTGSHDQILVVYDFGGGTFDATVLSLDSNGVYVLAKGGLTELGGKEIDEKIGEMILSRFTAAYGEAPPLTARMLLELRRVSEEIKIELAMPSTTRLRRTVLLGHAAVDIEIARSDVERAIDLLLQRTEEVTLNTIREAGVRIQDASALLLVGGSSMLPAVKNRWQRHFDRPGQRVIYHEPSKAVAFGAALHAAQLAGEAHIYSLPPEFRGVTGYCVGVRTIKPATGREATDTLIKKNMPLPVTVKKTYYTTSPNQQRIVLELVQYRSPGEALAEIGRLVVGPLPSPRQNYPIEVTVEMRDDGTVGVQAYDANTGVELAQVFGRDGDDGVAHLARQRALVRSTFINNA